MPAVLLRFFQGRVGVAATLFLLIAVGSPLAALTASAQAPAKTAIMKPSVARDAEVRSLAAAIEQVLRAKVEALGVVRLAGTPFAEMNDLQLAVGCLNDSIACYREVAEQLGVDAFLLPAIQRVEPAVVLTLTYVDTRGEGASKRAQRRFDVQQDEAQVVEALDPMLRELFGDAVNERADSDVAGTPAAKSSEPAAASSEHLQAPTDLQSEPSDDGFPVVSVVLGGAALAAIGTGVVFAVLASQSEDDYASAPTTTGEQVDRALDLKSEAELQGALATVFLIAGGALAASAGLVYWFGERSGGDAPSRQATAAKDVRLAQSRRVHYADHSAGLRVGIRPSVGPSQLGFALTGLF